MWFQFILKTINKNTMQNEVLVVKLIKIQTKETEKPVA
jgi:hypothetical protein